ncbi:MAG TPA: hypothetical protein VGS57_09430 [Thermoanaerobaculia bacterium]|jgi:hypothetical protein|nr:hypothetical protein [Thermoanaerobaculia bacterium]
MMLLRRKPAPRPDLQAAADAAAWRMLLRRRPEMAERIRLALAAGKPLQGVVDAAAQPAAAGALRDPAWPRLRLLLPCAVHGCARSLGLLAAARPSA